MATLNIKEFPDELYETLAQCAKRDHRSLRGETIYLLESAIKSSAKNRYSILELKGLGKNLSHHGEVTRYIEAERSSWE